MQGQAVGVFPPLDIMKSLWESGLTQQQALKRVSRLSAPSWFGGPWNASLQHFVPNFCEPSQINKVSAGANVIGKCPGDEDYNSCL